MTAECGLKPIRHLKGVCHSVGLSRSSREELKYVQNQSVIAGTEESEHVKQARECPCCVCASAKAEQKNSVAVFVDVHQVTVGIADVCQQSGSKRQTHH